VRRCERPDLPIDEFEPHAPNLRIGFEAGTFIDTEIPQPGWAHRHTFYEIALVLDGEGTHAIDSDQYVVRPATMYVMRPGQVHLWEYNAPPVGFAVLFTDEFLMMQDARGSCLRDVRLFNRLAEVAEISLTAEQTSGIVHLVQQMIGEYRRAQEGFRSVLQAYLHVLLTLAARAHVQPVADHRAGRAQVLTQQFLDLVVQRPAADQTVQTCSSVLGVTPGHLADTVRSVTGRRPSDLIREAQVLEAKRLLMHTDNTIAQVAYQLGFKDSAYFGRFFKRETGTTPGVFRRTATPGLDDERPRLAAVPNPTG
jgi:AraC family transcriptional activator of pobA